MSTFNLNSLLYVNNNRVKPVIQIATPDQNAEIPKMQEGQFLAVA